MARPSQGLLLSLLVAMTAVAAGMLALSSFPSSETDRLVQRLSQLPVDGFRFFSASSFDPASYNEALVDAAVFDLTEKNPRVRALMNAGRERLPEALKQLEKLAKTDPRDAALINDLGVVYWALGKERPLNAFKALQHFERAAQLAPNANPPRFNIALASERLYLHELAGSARNRYRDAGKSSLWSRTLDSSASDASRILELKRALDIHDETYVKELLHRHSDTYRTMALESALNPDDSGSPDYIAEFVLDYFGNKQHDTTMRAILAPLRTEARANILKARKLVSDGIKAYFKSDHVESLRLYDMAEASAKNSGSGFDQLWIDVNRADSRLRSARGDAEGRQRDITAAIQLLETVRTESQKLDLQWLAAQALVSKSAASTIVRNQDEVVPMLNAALLELDKWGTARDTARPLYYLAFIHSLSGDSEASLAFAYRSLRATPSDDHLRRGQLYWLIAREVYRHGFRDYAVSLMRQAVAAADLTGNSGIIATAVSGLATIKIEDTNEAEKLLIQARALRERLTLPAERLTLNLALNLLCSELRITTSSWSEAKACLEQNLETLKLEPRAPPEVFVQTLLGLAQVNVARGDFDTARQHLRMATEVIESNDTYFAIAALRMSFENQRRNLYDTAIGFEYDHDGMDAAWSYTQRYRSKLFLELLGRTNPAVAGVLDKAIDRNRVQALLPDKVQVVEYVVLKDRLLIWLLSKDMMHHEAISITRADMDSRVSDFIERVNNKEDVRLASQELYSVLIEPIQSRLDSNSTLAIIPDQALHRLSFGALLSPSGKFLIESFSILESPNLTTLLSGGGSPSRSGVVSFGAITSSTAASKELREMTDVYSDMQGFNGKSAIKPTFLSMLGDARIFHYAGHSQDAADPLHSAILLDGEREGPNSVTAADISRHRMPANSLVVLASCDSSVGNSRDGVGMRGLTSAFLISGAGSVVGSLWRVETDSTSQLVLDFHRNFAKRQFTIAESLRQAQLSFIKRGDHPYYWSGFVVTGNLSALR